MKQILLLAFCIMGLTLNAQIKTPAASPKCSFTQALGLGEMSVEYSRPSMKGRKIFATGGLLEPGNIWRLGANSPTKIAFTEDVTINGSALAAGKYVVLATPSAASWTFHFHTDEGGYWSDYKEKEPALNVTGKVETLPMDIETFMIVSGDHTDNSCKLEFLWENANVALDISTEVESKVMANIDKVMAGPSANDYYQAATFYHKKGKDLNQALSWIEKATSGDDKKFWQVRRMAMILGDLGKVKEAIKAAELSMGLAETAGNMEYVKMNKEFIMNMKNK